ncbi:MAG: prepilin-type N-terminal cleavage/methylation domain-containing protein [Candidatus Spechtbacteria bacterium]|nr:prepilin-type N-terminal cleavage/methylation domain-containing protein [Candidatus Spechtbacteria bacterium]
MTQHNQQTGFTLIELLIVIAITAIIVIITIVNSREGDKILAVDLSAQRIVAALREAQNDALGGKTVGGNHPAGGFGVHIKEGEPIYIFADINQDHVYNDGEEQQTINLEENAILQTGTNMDVSFVAPTPDVYTNGGPLGTFSTITITITSSDGSYTQIVNVNYVGAIWVEYL